MRAPPRNASTGAGRTARCSRLRPAGGEEAVVAVVAVVGDRPPPGGGVDEEHPRLPARPEQVERHVDVHLRGREAGRFDTAGEPAAATTDLAQQQFAVVGPFQQCIAARRLVGEEVEVDVERIEIEHRFVEGHGFVQIGLAAHQPAPGSVRCHRAVFGMGGASVLLVEPHAQAVDGKVDGFEHAGCRHVRTHHLTLDVEGNLGDGRAGRAPGLLGELHPPTEHRFGHPERRPPQLLLAVGPCPHPDPADGHDFDGEVGQQLLGTRRCLGFELHGNRGRRGTACGTGGPGRLAPARRPGLDIDADVPVGGLPHAWIVRRALWSRKGRPSRPARADRGGTRG